MSNPSFTPLPNPIPNPDDGDEQATVEVDGDAVLDPDVDDSKIDSASADRLASEDDPDAAPASGAGEALGESA